MSPVKSGAWTLHYAVTKYALRDTSCVTKPRSLSVFLKQVAGASSAIKHSWNNIFKNYYIILQNIGPVVVPNFEPTENTNLPLTELDFAKAALLAPRAVFPLIIKAATPKRSQSAEENIVWFDNRKDLFWGTSPKSTWAKIYYDAKQSGEPCIEVVATASDEPDWNFDFDLFHDRDDGTVVAGHPLGRLPYGRMTGESSKAPIHTWFQNEGFLSKKAAPFLAKSFLPARVFLFINLSYLARQVGDTYWAFRFLGWAFHYLEDLGQPYHAQAVPSASTWFYIKYLISNQKEKIKAETLQLMMNRHAMFEDYALQSLEQSNLGHYDSQVDVAFKNALDHVMPNGWSGAVPLSEATLLEWLKVIGLYSSSEAKKLDALTRDGFNAAWSQDASFNIETDPRYNLAGLHLGVDQQDQEELKQLTQKLLRRVAYVVLKLSASIH